MSNQELIELAETGLLRNYRQPGHVFVEGEGCRLRDADGREFLDLCAGIAVVSVGHGHPKLASAIAEQAGRLMHVSNLFYNEPAVRFAAELRARTPFDRFFFCNSGTEANEALLKLARRHHFDRGAPDRTRLVAAQRSFHGRTMGSLALTGQPKYHEGMGPMVGDVSHVPFGDLAALEAVVDDRTAAVFLEPVQGEGGVVVPPAEYLVGARRLCDRTGTLLFFDEVQTGFGRTGAFLAWEHSGVVPDGCSLAKGIAGGFPLGAAALREPFAESLPPGTHATTFGGNALACAAGLATLQIFDDEHLVDNAAKMGEHLDGRLRALAAEGAPGAIEEVRGQGLLRGVKLASSLDPGQVLAAVREQGVLLSLAGGDVLRFTPPLCVSETELDEGVEAVGKVLREKVGR